MNFAFDSPVVTGRLSWSERVIELWRPPCPALLKHGEFQSLSAPGRNFHVIMRP